MTQTASQASATAARSTQRRVRYVPVVGPRLKKLLAVVFGLFAILVVNSVYLLAITIAGAEFQNLFYQWMFLLHLGLGLAIILPIVLFGIFHIKNAQNRPNRRAVRVGYALFAISLIILISGILLTRFFVPLKESGLREVIYWAHVACPVLAIWLFVLHRLAGRRIKWRVGLTWAGVAAAFAGVMLVFHTANPQQWGRSGPASVEEYFFPALTRTSDGNFIPDQVLQNDQYCRECHEDVHDSWLASAHKFASFNNPAYEFSVKGTRRDMMERDGNVQGARFCAGCHDPVPLFSGAFDDPRFDDPDYDLGSDPMAQAGITCTVCHSISHVGTTSEALGVIGNGDYTITEPTHYPFAFSDNPALKWINRQLVKAKPEFHKATFLKPLHTTTEFCGTCHKVHLPFELNHYKYLRGQNHYDPFNLSGVSGQGIASFYYPPKAQPNCNNCHMKLQESDDFGAKQFAQDPEDALYNKLTVHNHQFPSANTGIVHLVRDQIPDPEAAIQAHRDFNEGVLRLDIFGVKKDGEIAGELIAPLRPQVPTLVPGETYLFETIIRTVKMGHIFTQGTADSNEVWMDVTVTSGDEVIGRSGGMREGDRNVDPWSHFVNAFVLDREGNRIDQRNAQDIFVPLYNNQIPPGAADVVHYQFTVPEHVTEPITVHAKLRFRKFDTTYLKHIFGDEFIRNDLPILELAEDTVTFPIDGGSSIEVTNEDSLIPLWQRWNDYGIALFRKGAKGELRGAAHAFSKVEELGYPDGPLNLARVYLKEGLIAEHAPDALNRARLFTPAANEWSVLWFTGLVNKRNGKLDEAIDNFEDIIEGGFAQAEGRGFDFSRDYNVLNELASTLYLRSKQERRHQSLRESFLKRALKYYDDVLYLDSENVAAHYGLKQVYTDLGDADKAKEHDALHQKYKPDDNARDIAIAKARIKYPAANNAAEAVVIYNLQRPNAYQLPSHAWMDQEKVAHHDDPADEADEDRSDS